MIPYYYYLDAKRRLHEMNLTIDAICSDGQDQPFLLAQRDIVKLEMEYYRDLSNKFAIIFLILFVVAVTIGLFCCYFLE